MKKAIPFLFVLSFILPAFYFSHQKKDDPNEYASITALLILPFDTAKVLEMMHIVDSVNEMSLFYNENLFPKYKSGANTLKAKIDTIDMRDMRWACDCPDWRYADSLRQDFSGENDFYIEPADPKLRLPDCLMIARVQFIGREYVAHGYPEGADYISPNPPRGKVFRYYAYKIYKPFSVYGPQVGPRDEDGYFATSQLIVK